MSYNNIFIAFIVAHAAVVMLSQHIKIKHNIDSDSTIYCAVALALVYFSIARPFGIGADDPGYFGYIYNRILLSPEGENMPQISRDYAWYIMVWMTDSIARSPRSILIVEGLCLSIKLYIIYRLTKRRSIALLCYESSFYIQHDIIALRLSTAVTALMIGIYIATKYKARYAAPAFFLSGLFHQQAFLTPLISLGELLRINSARAMIYLALVPIGLLFIGVFPRGELLLKLNDLSDGTIFDLMSGFIDYYRIALYKIAETLPGGPKKIAPYIIPAALFSLIIAANNLEAKSISMLKYPMVSIILGSILAWLYGLVTTMQLRLWEFYLVPSILLFGNTKNTLAGTASAYLFSAAYIVKYLIIARLLVG